MDEQIEQARQKLMEADVELVTFSWFWYSDSYGYHDQKAFQSDGTEVTSTYTYDELASAGHAVGYFFPKYRGDERKPTVFGWQVKNNRVQIVAEPQEIPEPDEVWRAEAGPNYSYSLENSLQKMLEASRWSPDFPNAQADLEIFLHHEDEFVRSSLAANPNVTEGTLVQLGYDHSPFVRNSVRMNPAIPDWLKKELGKQLE
jgi:hypothetical protein